MGGSKEKGDNAAKEYFWEHRKNIEFVLTSMPAVAYTADSRGRRVYFFSPGIQKNFGYTKKETETTPGFWLTKVHPEDRQTVLKATSMALQTGRAACEYRFAAKDGTYRWVRDESTFVKGPDGKPTGTIGIWIDVTERKRLEKIKEGLLTAVTHEFKTPLTSIISLASLLSEEVLGPLTERQKEALGILYASSMRLQTDVDSFMLYYRIKHGGLRIQKTKVNLKGVIAGEVHAQSHMLKKRGLDIMINVGNLPHVRCDPKWIACVISNLLSNAIKYTKKGGIVIVALKKNDNVVISIKDTGIGMQSSDIPLLFEEFFRANKHTGEGVGLGLATCKRIIEAHSGKIWAKSNGLGKGSTFFFSIPLK